MNISEDFVYVHVPKTGGSSFERTLEDNGVRLHLDQHSTACDIPVQHTHKPVIGFVRNPYISEVSNYRYHEYSWGTGMTFEDWVIWRYREHVDWIDKFDITPEQKQYGYVFAVNPQAGYFCDSSGECVATTVYYYEHVSQAVAEICETWNLRNTMNMHSAMNYGFGRQKPHESFYTPTSYDIITEVKAIDLEVFGYNFTDSPQHHCVESPEYRVHSGVHNYAYSRSHIGCDYGLGV